MTQVNVSVTTGNKENSKKLNNESLNTAAAAPKVSLKAREFGREITNAASSTNHGG